MVRRSRRLLPLLLALCLPGIALAQDRDRSKPPDRREIPLPQPTPDKVPAAATFKLLERSARSVPLGTVVLDEALRGAPRENAVDLARLGYVEEEYLVSGTGRVFADGKVARSGVPYVTRILVRRPVDPYRFSGTVQLEPLEAGTEQGRTWDLAWPRMVEVGDTWVGVTVARANIDRMHKKLDAARYGVLDIPDDGLGYDIQSQVAWMLRRPLDGVLAKLAFDDKSETIRGLTRIHAVGWNEAGCFERDYLNGGHHAANRRPNGRPVIDGYLIGSCAAGDKVALPTDQTPVLQIATESDYQSPEVAKQVAATRQPDVNLPQGRYRWYDVAGATRTTRVDLPQYSIAAWQTGLAQAVKCAQAPSRVAALATFTRAALFNLDRWPRLGAHAPAGAQFELADGLIKRDENGNAVGGVRSPWVNVPTATFMPASTDAGARQPDSLCPLQGHDAPFPRAKLAALYKNHADYVDKVTTDVVKLVNGNYMMATDADAMLKEIRAAAAQ